MSLACECCSTKLTYAGRGVRPRWCLDCRKARRSARKREQRSATREGREAVRAIKRPAPIERFIAKIDLAGSPDACWLWTAGQDGIGYAQFHNGTEPVKGHRFAYSSLVGPIPAEMQLDHLCRVRHCVNPAHLEPVTRRENILRGTSPSALNATKTHCKAGHPLSGGNLYRGSEGERRCLACKRVGDRQRKRAERLRRKKDGAARYAASSALTHGR